MTRDKPLRRSQLSYGKKDRDGFIHRSWMKSQGFPEDVFDGRPVIGICNTWSELTPCNLGLRDVAEHVKRGVWEAGGLPLEFPVMSLGETQMRPTAMLFRNLLAMEAEESIRGNPIDGVVLLGGCDKTTPGQLMGAASVNLPTIVVSGGPMLNGRFRGKTLGSGTDVWKLSEEVRAGGLTPELFYKAEAGLSRSTGSCNTMGTASTMASMCEALGVSLPYNATTPAVDAGRRRIAHQSGRRIVEMVRQDLRLSQYLTREAFLNAVAVHAAIGGSTNAVLHLLAVANRIGVEFSLADFDASTHEIPLLVNLQPSGEFLMEEFHYAGGVPAVMKNIQSKLHLAAETVDGRTIKEIAAEAECFNEAVIRPCEKPVKPLSGIWVLSGNLCPKGAIIKPNAASPELLEHRGKAVVFESIEDFKSQIDDRSIELDSTAVLVLKGCGPRGYPGMPEVGNMPLPKKLLERGVQDMLRLSDARMSGTAYGTVILHVAPEAAAGGPIALVETGDEIIFDGPARRLFLNVDEATLERRRKVLSRQTDASPQRGYAKLYTEHVLQADEGCDFDFLVGASGDEVARESH